MSDAKFPPPSYEELRDRLAEVEEVIRVLRSGEVDAIIGDRDVALVRLRATEESLSRLTMELEARVRELAQANASLQELDRLKSMFIASMSHELRTPLNIIIGFTGIMLQGRAGPISAEQDKQLKMIKEAGEHLLVLVNEVIDVSKIEAGKVELAFAAFDLAELVQEVVASFDVQAKGKGLELSLGVPESLPIESDRRRVKQILVNLVGNSLKFTDRGRIDVALAACDGNAMLSVRDTGIGIRKQDLGKLFTAFGKIWTEGREQEGSGLGLYLSQKIAHLLGGHISAESEFGAGSVFTLSIPMYLKRPSS